MNVSLENKLIKKRLSEQKKEAAKQEKDIAKILDSIARAVFPIIVDKLPPSKKGLSIFQLYKGITPQFIFDTNEILAVKIHPLRYRGPLYNCCKIKPEICDNVLLPKGVQIIDQKFCFDIGNFHASIGSNLFQTLFRASKMYNYKVEVFITQKQTTEDEKEQNTTK